MDVLTDSSLTLIVKTSEQDNANALENTGGDSALLPHIRSSDSHLLTENILNALLSSSQI